MATNNLPNTPQKPSGPNSSDSTLSAGDLGGTAAALIGPYRLLRVLGEGGMGQVWLAEQTTPIHRTVALKLIKAGMDTKAVVARFESERQALALMDHPNIAQVYDAGSTIEGRPYFAMEYVPGLPITEYCDRHRLTMSERLELFRQVCDGVQHAHQKAIIHRDLKPSNVLVVEQSGKSIPKIIDFGLAKAIAQRLTDKTMFTEIGVLVGTPEYASPEQADLREQNIDTRTDVYSLGVILYELLVGALPFDAKTLRAAGLEAILRVIREQAPPKPSTKVRLMGDSSITSAENRREEPGTFARRLQGELDWITLKALEKDRVRRYGTASEFSADLSHYLHGEPVLAGPATAAYRIRKYAGRHRFELGAAAIVLVLLIGFAIAQSIELHRIRLERSRANRERDRANRITDFMTGMFKVSDPSEARGNSVTAREILDKASGDIDSGLTMDPELRARMMQVMSNVYDNLGLFPRAESLNQRALEIRRRVLGPDHPDTLSSMNNLGLVLMGEGRYPEAEKLNRETLDADRRVLGPEDPDTLSSMSNLALVLWKELHYPEAESLNRKTLEIRRRVLGPEHPETLKSMSNLSLVLSDEGHYAEAEKLDRDRIEVEKRVVGPDHPDTLGSMGNLALVLSREGRYAEAEKQSRDTIEADKRILGPDHPETLAVINNFALVLSSQGRYAEAEQLYRETLESRRRVLGPDHPDTLRSMNNLASGLIDEGHYKEGEEILKQVREIQNRILGPEHPDTAVSTYNLGCVTARLGRRNEALALLREAVDHGLPVETDLNLDQDADLKSLHGDPRFGALLAHAKEVAASAQKPN